MFGEVKSTVHVQKGFNKPLALCLIAVMASIPSLSAKATSVGVRLGIPTVGIDLNPNSSLFPSVRMENEPEFGDYQAVDIGVIGFNITLFNLDTTLNDVQLEGGIFDTSAYFDNIDSANASGTGVILGYGARFDVNPVYFKLGAGLGGGKFDLDVSTDNGEDFSESTGLFVWELRGGVGFKLTENLGLSADYRYMRSPNIGVRIDGQTGDGSLDASIFSAGVDFKF